LYLFRPYKGFRWHLELFDMRVNLLL